MEKDNLDLDQAIDHIDEVVKDCNKECRAEHLQLKKWLIELKELRNKEGKNGMV